MKKSTILILGFVLLALIDSFVGYIFPIDYSFVEYSVVPHFCLIGTLIYVKDKEPLNRVLIGCLVGLCFDMLFTMSFPLDLVLFGLASYGIGFLEPWMKSRKIECLILLVFAFLYDFMPFIWDRLFNPDYATFGLWFVRFEVITIVLNAGTIVFLKYVEEVMSRFFLIRSYRDKKIK